MLKLFSNKALSLLPDRVVTREHSRKYENVKVGDVYKRVKVPNYPTTSSAKVEPKVYLANERTLVSYINMGVLMASLSMTLYNSSNDSTSKYFGFTYSMISIITILYGYYIYQTRLELIKSKSASHFDQIIGPIAISSSLFICICYNFYTKFMI